MNSNPHTDPFQARTTATNEIREALRAAADKKDAAEDSRAAAVSDFNTLVAKIRDEHLLGVQDILDTARIKRSWLYQINKAGQ